MNINFTFVWIFYGKKNFNLRHLNLMVLFMGKNDSKIEN